VIQASLPATELKLATRRETRLLDDEREHRKMARAVNPFGDGRASERIVAALLGEPVEPFEVAAAAT